MGKGIIETMGVTCLARPCTMDRHDLPRTRNNIDQNAVRPWSISGNGLACNLE